MDVQKLNEFSVEMSPQRIARWDRRKQGWGGRVFVGLCCSWFVLVSSWPISGGIHRKLTDPVPEWNVHFVYCTNYAEARFEHTRPPRREERLSPCTLPRVGYLRSPLRTKLRPNSLACPDRPGSLVPRSGCQRLYAGCVQSLPRPTTLLHLAAPGGVGVCVCMHTSVCMCVSFDVPV